jgi:Phosphogluconate dehydrogenase (decarboxylating) C-term
MGLCSSPEQPRTRVVGYSILMDPLLETPGHRPGSCVGRGARPTTPRCGGCARTCRQGSAFGHVQVALANTLRGSNPFSDACLIAMDYGRESIVRDDWKKIFDDGRRRGVPVEPVAHHRRLQGSRPTRHQHQLIANILAGLTAEGSLAEQVRELITDPLAGGPALIEAINLAFAFFGTNPST